MESLGCLGVVAASPYGGVEVYLSIFVGGLSGKVVIRIFSFAERGWGDISGPAPTQPPEEE